MSISMEEVNERLASYVGGTACLWGFTATHDRLAFELNNQDKTRREYLILLGCTAIQTPTWCRVGRMEIAAIENGFILTGEGLRVSFAYEFQLTESYEPS